MNAQKQRLILYLITATIFTTIVVQFYWNYNNYLQNKQRVINEIQISLDNTIETYYVNMSKKNFFTIVEPKNLSPKNKQERDTIFSYIFKSSIGKKKTNKKSNIEIEFLKISKDGTSGTHIASPNHISNVQVFRGKKASDSLKLIKGLQTMIIAIHNDSINYNEIDSIFTNELQKKGIGSQFYFTHLKKDTIFFNSKITDYAEGFLMTEAKSTFLKPNESFVLHHSHPKVF